MSVTRYLDINSSFRDRVQYPEAFDFIVTLNENVPNTSATATDPILLAFPYETNLTSGGSTVTQIALSVTSSNVVNFYRNSFLVIGNEYRLITSYDNVTQIATVTPGFSVAPLAVTPYTIRQQLPVKLNAGQYQDTTSLNAAQRNEIYLGALASSVNNRYVDYWVFVPGPSIPYSYQWKRIVSYDGATKKAVVAGAFVNLIPAGTVYEIMEFSYNNVRPLRYVGTEVGVNNPSCVTLTLLALIIPNRKVLNGYGGNVPDYPYVYVSVTNVSQNSYVNPLISNSPYIISDALFKCPVTYYNDNKFLSLISTGMSPKVNFKENDNLRIRVYLPSGEILKIENDPNTVLYSSQQYGGYLFPIPSNPFNQVNMTLQLSR